MVRDTQTLGPQRTVPKGRTCRQCRARPRSPLVSREFCFRACLKAPVFHTTAFSVFPPLDSKEEPALPLRTSCLGSINKCHTSFLLPQGEPALSTSIASRSIHDFCRPDWKCLPGSPDHFATSKFQSTPALLTEAFFGPKERVSGSPQWSFLWLYLCFK